MNATSRSPLPLNRPDNSLAAEGDLTIVTVALS